MHVASVAKEEQVRSFCSSKNNRPCTWNDSSVMMRHALGFYSWRRIREVMGILSQGGNRFPTHLCALALLNGRDVQRLALNRRHDVARAPDACPTRLNPLYAKSKAPFSLSDHRLHPVREHLVAAGAEVQRLADRI
jgi:hypothetical protein